MRCRGLAPARQGGRLPRSIVALAALDCVCARERCQAPRWGHLRGDTQSVCKRIRALQPAAAREQRAMKTRRMHKHTCPVHTLPSAPARAGKPVLCRAQTDAAQGAMKQRRFYGALSLGACKALHCKMMLMVNNKCHKRDKLAELHKRIRCACVAYYCLRLQGAVQ